MDIAAPGLHKRIIDMCDCYLETDYLAAMRAMIGKVPADVEEEAIKYFALTILYGLTGAARKISIKRKAEKVSVFIENDEDETTTLPVPDRSVVERLIAIMGQVMHIDGEKAKMPLALSLKNGQFDVEVKLEQKGSKESLKIRFS